MQLPKRPPTCQQLPYSSYIAFHQLSISNSWPFAYIWILYRWTSHRCGYGPFGLVRARVWQVKNMGKWRRAEVYFQRIKERKRCFISLLFSLLVKQRKWNGQAGYSCPIHCQRYGNGEMITFNHQGQNEFISIFWKFWLDVGDGGLKTEQSFKLLMKIAWYALKLFMSRGVVKVICFFCAMCLNNYRGIMLFNVYFIKS